MGIAKLIADKFSNQVARLSALSPEQISEIQNLREDYFEWLSKANPNDPASVAYTNGLLAASSVEIFDAYLSQIKDLYQPAAREVELNGKDFKPDHNIRFLNITKWVTNREENSLEKLTNVYEVLSDEDCNIALIFHRTRTETQVYLAVSNRTAKDDNTDIKSYINRLASAVKGNFPGAEFKDAESGIPQCLRKDIDYDFRYSVASVSNVPTEKSEKFISQTIEKLLDGIVPEKTEQEYTLILLATPVQNVEEKKMRLAELYSGLAPYASWQTNFTMTESDSVSSNMQVGLNIGASAGIQNGQNQAITNSHGATDSSSKGETNTQGETVSDARGMSKTTTEGTTATDSENIGTSKTQTVGSSATATSGSTNSRSHAKGSNTSYSQTEGSGDTLGVNATATLNLGRGLISTVGRAVGEKAGWNVGGSFAPVGIGINGGVSKAGVTLSDSTGSSTNHGFNIGAGVHYDHNWNRSLTELTGESLTDTVSTGTSRSLAKGSSISTAAGESHTIGQSLAKSASQSVGQNIQHTVANATSQALTKTLGKAVTNTVSQTAGRSKGINLGTNFGMNFARSSNVTATVGRNEGLTQSYTNYQIKYALQLLEEQMKRFEQSAALGMWDFAAYVLSEDANVANNVAHSYLALTQGEKSFMTKAAINLWRGDLNRNDSEAREICEYLRELHHPIFGLRPGLIMEDPTFYVYPPVVTATTSLTGKELAYSLNFPKKSVAGLPVLECAEFGRNVVTYGPSRKNEEMLRLGQVFHMNHSEKTVVNLSLNSLTAHTFITGSTGAGKSNTVYQILDQASKRGETFLVIEPAKGEYKHIFGSGFTASVFGTNPAVAPILRINPFSFPKGIHILEHLDRLVEIFNVCWPMYAAMPAVLKNAVEKSYADCGWNLVRSVNRYGEDIYPSFADVARNIKEIIDTSEYDSDNKGAYKGSLLTRLQSLTNGINGMIFTCDEIADTDLFDKNVIVDLSRVGSSETKSLIMGMLVLKLQEYRIATATGMNENLKHITVLEEAHNLLKRTSTEQASESANLRGKSVEMLANAIAEMRTYGEGFVIADQAPGLLDLSVIRNTNTKIIMRLPDRTDRELVGRAANLNDGQIAELAKLPCGVAAIYQNEWVQPVLCKVAEYPDSKSRYSYNPQDNDEHLDEESGVVTESLLDCIMNKELFRKGNRADILRLKERVIRSKLDTSIKKDFVEYISANDTKTIDALRQLVYNFLSAEDAICTASHCNEISAWVHSVVDGLTPSIKDYSKKQIDLALALILHEQVLRDAAYNDLLVRFAEIYKAEGGVF